MKKFIKTVMMFLSIILFACIGSISCLAVEINGQEVNIGDTITYEIRAKGCTKPVQGVGASIHYDSGTLQYTAGSIELPLLKSSAVNDGLQDQIIFNAVDLNGFDFFNDNVLARVTFTVVDDYNPYPRLSYEVESFIDADGADFGDIYTYDVVTVTASGKPVESTVSSVTSNFTASGETNAPINSQATSQVSSKSDASSVLSSQANSSVSSVSSSESSQNDSAEETNSSQISQKSETKDSPDTVSQARMPEKLPLSYALAAVIIVAVLIIVFLFVRLANSRGKHID